MLNSFVPPQFRNNKPDPRAKLTPRDRDLIHEIWQNTSATRKELSIAFGVSSTTIGDNTTGVRKL